MVRYCVSLAITFSVDQGSRTLPWAKPRWITTESRNLPGDPNTLEARSVGLGCLGEG